MRNHSYNEPWGDDLKQKEEVKFQLLLIHVNGLPTTNYHYINKQIRERLDEWEIDFCGMTEVNTFWQEVPSTSCLYWRTIHW